MTQLDQLSTLTIPAPSMPESMIVEPLSLFSSAPAAMARLARRWRAIRSSKSFLHRARLEAVRRQADGDSELVDP
jgi:hypothetical protein